MRSTTKKRQELLAVIVLVCGIIILTANAAGAWKWEPQILPMQEEYYGKTYSELAVKWWQWAIGTPAVTNPIIDTTGDFCASGQTGPVWFLATTLGWNPGVVRSCTIPLGKSLFFPVINAAYFAFPGEEWKEADLRAQSDCRIPTELTAEIDGIPVKNLYQYFEHSPIFKVDLPAGDIFGAGPLLLSPSAGQGYYLFLLPLPKGTHTIHWKATWLCPFQTAPFTEEVTYNLTIGQRHPPKGGK